MANSTGEYDVVTEVSIGLVNAILAVIHANENETYPQLPHSVRENVDDSYRGTNDPIPEAQRTGVQTSAEVQASTPTVSLPISGLVEPVWSTRRPAVRTAVRVGGDVRVPIGPLNPGRGPTCWPQISARVRLRAWLRDRPSELPEFLDGDLWLTAGLMRTDLAGKTFLGFDYSSGPDVSFEPSAGTSLTDEQRGVVDQILRNYLRAEAEPVSFKVDLPDDVRRFDYALQPEGPRQSAMLMFRLTDKPAGPLGPRSVTARFLPAGADFAVAVGRDHLLEQLGKKLLLYVQPEYGGSGTGYSYRIRPDWSSTGFDLQPGRIVVTVSGSGSITYGFPPFAATDGWTFTVRQPVALEIIGGSLMPAVEEDPDVELHDVAAFEGTIRDGAKKQIRAQFTQTLAEPDLAAEMRKDLDVTAQLEKVISALTPTPPGVVLTGVEIGPDGVVVIGTVALAPSSQIVVKRAPLNGVSDAFESWIPGGTIERFVWDGRVEEHRFVTQKRIGVVDMSCLSVQGTRVTHGGGLVAVSAEDCPLVVSALPVVSGLPPPHPCHRPLLPLLSDGPEGKVEVIGHYDPWATGLAPAAGPTNMLVHFPGGRWADAARVIEEALAKRKEDAALVVVGVLDRDELAAAAEATLAGRATLLLTEDSTGSWSRALAAETAPATVLVGPDGMTRWKGEGELDPGKLAKVLDEQLEPGGQVSWRALRTAVGANDRAPDAPLRLGDGSELPFRRLRGKPAVLSFWTSCSEPSIEQLRQLREALEVGGEDQPAVLGIGDGESQQQVAEVEKREQLPFALVADSERAFARRYGVHAWPTVVQIGADGLVATVGHGLFPGLSPCAHLKRALDRH